MAILMSQNGCLIRESAGINQKFVDKNILGDIYKCVEISNNVFLPIENLRYKDENITYITNSALIDRSVSQCIYYNCDESTYKSNGYLYTYPAIQYINTLIVGTNLRGLTQSDVTSVYNYIKSQLSVQSVIPIEYLDSSFFTKSVKDRNVGWINSYGLIDLGFRPTGYWNGSFNGITTYMGFGTEDTEFCDIQTDNSNYRFISPASWTQHCYASRFIIDEN